MPNYYPVMLDVRGRQAIVIGGNSIAAEKAAALVASGADVSVLSQEFCAELLAQAEQKRVTLLPKAYEPGDLARAFVVIAVTNNPRLIELIWAETQERGQLVNIVDVPEYCSFILPSVLRRGQLTIAVSTEGASPSLAKRIRQSLEEFLPPSYSTYIQLAALARAYLRENGISYKRRDDFFSDFFASDVLSQLAERDTAQATRITARLLGKYDVDVEANLLQAAIDRDKSDL